MDDAHTIIHTNLLEKWQRIVDLLTEITGISSTHILYLHNNELTTVVSSKAADTIFTLNESTPYEKSDPFTRKIIESGKELFISKARHAFRIIGSNAFTKDIVSYIGLPLHRPDDEILGVLCGIDPKETNIPMVHYKLFVEFREMIESEFQNLVLTNELKHKNRDLRLELDEIKTLRGLLSMCVKCKSIKNDEGNWHKVDHYITRHTMAELSHTLCPCCSRQVYGDAVIDFIQKERP